MGIHPDISAYIEKYEDPARSILLKIRQVIINSGPFTEAIKWGNPTFENERKVCYISWYKNHAKLGFFDCRMVKDSRKLLEGTGTKMRHIKIYRDSDIDSEYLTDLLKQAAAG